MTDDTRPAWALFDNDGEHHGRGYHTSERAADDDLYGRPDGTYVAPACLCLGYVREAYDCVVCSLIEEYGYAE